MAGSAREEAERLVASVLARAVTGQAFGEKWATGEPECCVCPVCKAIAAMRDPSPQTAARLAGSAGDLAGSVAGLLRSVSAIVGERPKPASPPAAATTPNADQAWSVATRASRPGDERGRFGRPDDGGRPGEPGGAAVDEAGGSDVNQADGAWAAATNGGGERAAAQGDDPWAAATTASAADAAADYAAELAERRAAALQAAADAERRVAEAAALAKARREAASRAAAAADETGDTAAPVAGGARTPRRLDVWAAATADAGVASPPPAAAVDHGDEAEDADGAEAGEAT